MSDLAVIDALRNRNRQLQRDNIELQELGPRLPVDPPLAAHGYGRRMISLSINVAQKVGFRSTEATLLLVFSWLGVTQKVPDWTTIRIWMLRQGVAALKASIERANDWIWMVDHSNQIGQEKVLVVLGIRASQLPDPETPPSSFLGAHAMMRLLAIKPGTSWKTSDMERVYQELAERLGTPLEVRSAECWGD